jgi:hypothetical protein
MNDTVFFNVSGISKKFETVLCKIFNILDMSDINNLKENNIEIYKILENPNDEIVFNDTVEYLKTHKDIKQREILLSNNSSLIISID